MLLVFPRRTTTRAALAVAMTTAAAIATIPVAQAVPPQPVHSESTDIAFSGVFDGAGVNEPVDVTGTVHITVQADIGDTGGIKGVTVHTNLSDTTGVGEFSRTTYRFSGSDFVNRTFPPSPVRFFPFFNVRAVPPNPVYPPNPCQLLDETISFNGDGSIANISAVVSSSGGGTT